MKTDFFAFSAQGLPAAPYQTDKKSLAPPSVVPESINIGKIKSYPLGSETNLGEFSFKTKEREILHLMHSDRNRILFMFNQGDSFELKHCGGSKSRLSRYENLIIHCQKNSPISLIFQPQRSFKATFIDVDVKYFRSYLPADTEALEMENINFKSKPDLSIADYVHQINIQPKKFPNNLITLGFASMAAGALFHLYLKKEQDSSTSRPSLRSWEIKALEEITEKIRQNPEQIYTVEEVSKETGISIPHLQQGFKEMHGHTVANFIREVRLAKAEELIKNSDLNISEIVYTIGLSSRSYFSRIFKKKFKCSPSVYQRLQFSE